MSKGFKPGDLALLINTSDKNDFKTVELLEFLGVPERIPFGDIHLRNSTRERIWLVRSCKDPITFSKAIRKATGISSSMESPAAERHLMPLRDDDLPAETLDIAAPRELISA